MQVLIPPHSFIQSSFAIQDDACFQSIQQLHNRTPAQQLCCLWQQLFSFPVVGSIYNMISQHSWMDVHFSTPLFMCKSH